jgi:WD40 repeat protein
MLGNSKTITCFDFHEGIRCHWDIESGKEELYSFYPEKLGGICVSGSGKYIALLAKKGDYIEIDYWDSAQKVSFVEEAMSHGLFSFSPDEKYLLASSDGGLVLWEVSTGKSAGRFQHGSRWVSDAVMSQDGRHLLTIHNDNTVVLWDVGTKEIIKEFVFEDDKIEAACFHKDVIILVGEQIHFVQWPPIEHLILQLRDDFKDYPLSEKDRKDFYID